eukprot:gene10248-12567_t
MKKVLLFAGCLLLAFLPALSGFVTRPDAWYDALSKPPLQPPPWIFAPVWTLLYALMGIAHGLYTVTPAPGITKGRGHTLQIIQLALNAAWSLLFFGAHSPLVAGIEILVLLIAIALTAHAFGRVSNAARWLLYPYLAWVSFATYLNWGLVWLNR